MGRGQALLGAALSIPPLTCAGLSLSFHGWQGFVFVLFFVFVFNENASSLLEPDLQQRDFRQLTISFR